MAPRIYGCAVTIALTCYGILYGGAALISAQGGRWMQQVEPANFAMAFTLILGCAALTGAPGTPTTLSSPPCGAGETAPTAPLPGWRDLWAAGMRLQLTPAPVPEPHCPAP